MFTGRYWVSNPSGNGGIQTRMWQRYASGQPGVPICGARCRRSPGLVCRGAPIAGGRCRHHGGLSSGRGRPVLGKSELQHHSKAIALIKKASRALLETVELHPDTQRNFAPYAGSLYPPSEAMALLACDQWTRGEVTRAEFEIALEQARLYADGPRPRQPKPFKTARPAPKPSELRPTERPRVEAQRVDRRSAALRDVSATEPQPERWSADRSKKPSG